MVDVAGYFTTDTAALTYVADQATPRVLDTRGGAPATPGEPPSWLSAWTAIGLLPSLK